MTWKKDILQLKDGRTVQAQYPVIVSASRSTDIPAFYADWFLHRLKEGYSVWQNPFSGARSYVAYRDTRFIVFWSKNPRPLLTSGLLDWLDEHGISCYVQYSLNNYEPEELEAGVPKLDYRLDTFKMLVDRLGRGRVVWRFDPLLLTDAVSSDFLLDRIAQIGDQLEGYTERLVFSFADIIGYKKVKKNLEEDGVHYIDWTEHMMTDFAARLARLNSRWHYELATCGEQVDLSAYGIAHNRCVDDRLMIRFAYKDSALMRFLKVKFHPMPEPDLFGNTPSLPADAIVLPNGTCATHGNNRDTGQRPFCCCAASKDIGQYNTCIHDCAYCYANASRAVARDNYKSHRLNPTAETITGH